MEQAMERKVQQRDPVEERAILDAIEVWVEKEVRPIAKKFDLAAPFRRNTAASDFPPGPTRRSSSRWHRPGWRLPASSIRI